MAFEKIAADAAALTKHNTQIFWLAAWLVNNVGITILNKHAFSRTPFHYPWVVSDFFILIFLVASLLKECVVSLPCLRCDRGIFGDISGDKRKSRRQGSTVFRPGAVKKTNARCYIISSGQFSATLSQISAVV